MASVEAKSLCIKNMEKLLAEPMFGIFHVQHQQISDRTETMNDLLFHFKNSMAKVRQWNAPVVKEFCTNLVTKFPALREFETLFRELQDIICSILNETSSITTYRPEMVEVHEALHAFISACSDSFIGHPQWFAIEEDST